VADRIPLVLGTDANGQIIFEELPAGDEICAPICGMYSGGSGGAGAQGPQGPQGPAGTNGSDGSAGSGYTRAQILGPTLFVDFIKPDGSTLLEELGKVVGDNGSNGSDGSDGSAGSGYTRARIVGPSLFVDFIKPDGSTLLEELGKVVGDNGSNGTNGSDGSAGSGYTRARIVGPSLFVDFIKPDGSTLLEELGKVVGDNGSNGNDGAAGSAGSGFTRARISGPSLFVDFIKPDGSTLLEELGKVVGDTGSQGAQGTQGAQGDAGPKDRIVVAGLSMPTNLTGEFKFTGPNPRGGQVFKFMPNAEGSSYGLRPMNDVALGIVTPGDQVGAEFDFSQGVFGSDGNFIEGSDGNSPVTLLFISGQTLAATGSGHIAADKIRKSDNTILDVTGLPITYFAGDADPEDSGDVPSNQFNSIAATFRGIVTTAGLKTNAGLNVSGVGNFAKSINLSGVAIDTNAPLSYSTTGTVDYDGTVATISENWAAPHMHGEFLWTRFLGDSNNATTSNLGQGLSSDGDTATVKSIPTGAAAGDDTFLTFTKDPDGSTPAAWRVGTGTGVYRVLLCAIVSNSAVNPTVTIDLDINGSTKHTIANNSYSVISPQCMTLEWVGQVGRTSWDIEFTATASTGNCAFKSGTTVSIVRIA